MRIPFQRLLPVVGVGGIGKNFVLPSTIYASKLCAVPAPTPPVAIQRRSLADHSGSCPPVDPTDPLDDDINLSSLPSSISDLVDFVWPYWPFSHWLEDALLSLHDVSGCSWWMILPVCSLARICLLSLPDTYKTRHYMSTKDSLVRRLNEVVRQRQEATRRGQKARLLKLRNQEFQLRQQGPSELKAADHTLWTDLLTPILASFIFATNSLCILHLAAVPTPGFLVEGLWWFPDLTAPSHFLLPFICVGVQALIFFADRRRNDIPEALLPNSGSWSYVANTYDFVNCLCILSFGYYLPSGLLWFWLVCNCADFCSYTTLRKLLEKSKLKTDTE